MRLYDGESDYAARVRLSSVKRCPALKQEEEEEEEEERENGTKPGMFRTFNIRVILLVWNFTSFQLPDWSSVSK